MPKYEAYKDSQVQWIGDIPANWHLEKAKWLFYKADRKPLVDDDIVTCFRDGQVTLRKNRRTEGFTNALKEHGYQRICKGDLVIHAMDAFAGAIGVSDSDGKSTPVYAACVPRKIGKVNSYYYAYYMRDLALSGFIVSLAKGIRERSTDFRFNDFAELLLPFPDYEEQTLIANFLDKKTALIDEAISIKEQQISLLKERKQIIIQQAVTQGLDPNVPMKDSGVDWIGKIPAHWDIVPGFTVFKEGKDSNKGMIESQVLSLSYGNVIIKPEEKLVGLVPESFETYQIALPG
ncbi:restriction endonuclease subunit S, partial [Escherichia coli]|nr:restriction endonuclease subunit S [Escherichia coli]